MAQLRTAKSRWTDWPAVRLNKRYKPKRKRGGHMRPRPSLSLSIFSLCWETSAVKKEKYQKGGWATANSHQTNHPQTSATLIYTLQSDVSNESPKEGATQANGSISRYPIAETFLSSFRGVTSSTPFGSALKSFAPLWTIWEPPDQSSV